MSDTPDCQDVNAVKIEELEKRLALYVAAADAAVKLAADDLRARLEVMNKATEAVEKELKSMELFRAALEGKATQSSVAIAVGIALAGLVLSLADIILRLSGH